MIETMERQHAEFKNEMREYDLSHETDLRANSSKLDVCLCDDGASFTPLESKLEEVLDPSAITPSLVAPPSSMILRDNITFNMTLPDSPFPLAPLMEFKEGVTFTVNDSVAGEDVCYDSDHGLTEGHNSDVTPVGRSYGDVMATIPPSPDIAENVPSNHLDSLHVSLSSSPPSPSPEYHPLSLVAYHNILEGHGPGCCESLGTFRGYDPSLDPYKLILEDMPGKITIPVAFIHSTDFSKAFDKFMRALVINSVFLFKCSYLHTSELHAQVFDKLLRALTASELPRTS